MTSQETFMQAVRVHQAGNPAEAERLYRKVMASSPPNASVLHMLGVAVWQNGRAEEGRWFIERAIDAEPRQAEFYGSLGLVLASEKNYDAAVAAYHRAIALKPEGGQFHGNLGLALHAQGNLAAAAAAYRRGLELRPNWPQIANNLGSALLELGQLEEAVAALLRAAKLQPNDPLPRRNLARALTRMGRFESAAEHAGKAIELSPGRADDYNTLGAIFQGLNRLDDAAAAYEKTLELDPRCSSAMSNLGYICKETGDLPKAIECFRRASDISPEQADVESNRLCSLYFDPEFDGPALRREHSLWNDKFARPLRNSLRAHENDRSPNRRLRIGYVSPDLRGHVVGWNLLPLLSKHDHRAFEIVCYASVAVPDAVTEQIKRRCDGWVNILPLDDRRAAETIRADRVDILVDLSLHMAHNRLLTFARKPAPVQVTYLGYCGTTGLETMDYRLSDPHLDPPDGDLSHYAEQTVRLPVSYWCYQPSGPAPDVGPPPWRSNGFITFGCLNNFAKVSAPAMRLWGRVLEATPNSRLLVHCPEGSHRRRVLERFDSAGVDPGRLDLVGFQSRDVYMQTYHRIDVALDPFPYGGGITTCDGLWMGVPAITLSGSTAVGRGGRSILSNIGLPHLVAHSADEYVHLASEAARWTELRPTLRGRMEASPLMDAGRFARDAEAAFRRMWLAWAENPRKNS
jgi:predicted O-linked N-acetylglucosamine transferase (SPINDLY family)